MESVKVKEFLSIDSSSAFGLGSAPGSGFFPGLSFASTFAYGSGFTSASTYTYGSASGSGYASGSGSGYGYGHGYASGSGSGYASGSGSGSADASGYGSGPRYGWGIKSFINKPVYRIDDTPTIIQSIRGNVAKCLILKPGLTTTPCFVVKVGNSFAHGKTIKEAFLDAQAKHFDELPEDERLQAFVDAHEWGLEYPDKDFYDWHNNLTGSCKMGRDMFAKEHGLEKLDGKHTVEWFVDLTKDAYGGDIIKRIPGLYKNKQTESAD